MSGPSDYVFEQYSKPKIVGVGITFTILPVFVVALRFYARHITRVAFGFDDWSILFALVSRKRYCYIWNLNAETNHRYYVLVAESWKFSVRHPMGTTSD